MSNGPGGSGRLVSVNVVHALIPDPVGDLGRTAIDKRPVAGRVAVGRLGVHGDQQFDTRHHGGPDQAVYAYAREDYDAWARELGRDLPNGVFGDNLTTSGVDVTGAVIGERWAVGDVLLRVRSPRIPCRTFAGWIAQEHWVRRFTERGAPGAYLSVEKEGGLSAGDPVEVVDRPAHDATVGDLFAVLGGDRDRARLARLDSARDDLVAATVEKLARLGAGPA